MPYSMEPSRKRYLEERIVFCANCDDNRLLQANSYGLVCAACASQNWMYLPNAIKPAAASALSEAPPDNVSNALMEKVAEQKRDRPKLRLVG